jgi:hypothetical protein
MNPFIERHRTEICSVISCFDRVVITGTLVDIGHPQAMARYLGQQHVRLFDFPRWAEPLRDELRAHAEQLAADSGVTIEFIRRHKAFRKEDRIQAILAERGEHPGLVHIFSAMEACTTYRPWYDKRTQRTELKITSGKCLHYYFYFIDEVFGLCYMRVPTWAPFRLQVYFNGHNWLARRLKKAGIAFLQEDNAFVYLADGEQAQALADSLDARQLHRRLDRWARTYCPVAAAFRGGHHWSFMQVEFATDVMFERHAAFQPLYEALVRTAIHAVKPEHVATFFERKLTRATRQELGNHFDTRIQGTRIRHHMGPASIKLYDKFGRIARVECTLNDVTFLKHPRWVKQRDGTRAHRLAPLRKRIYSLHHLRKLMSAANERYLSFLAAIDNPDAGLRAVDKMAKPARENHRSYRGFNLFLGQDFNLFLILARGEWSITGFRAAHLRRCLPELSPSRASYLLKRLRTHGLIKKVGRRYKYYLTKLGRRVVATTLVLRETLVVPSLAEAAA